MEVYEERERRRKRPVFDSMITAAKRGKFAVLVVWAIDRFGRSVVENLISSTSTASAFKSSRCGSRRWSTGGPVRSLLIRDLLVGRRQETGSPGRTNPSGPRTSPSSRNEARPTPSSSGSRPARRAASRAELREDHRHHDGHHVRDGKAGSRSPFPRRRPPRGPQSRGRRRRDPPDRNRSVVARC